MAEEKNSTGSPSTQKMVKVVRRDPTAEGDKAHLERQIVKRPWQR